MSPIELSWAAINTDSHVQLCRQAINNKHSLVWTILRWREICILDFLTSFPEKIKASFSFMLGILTARLLAQNLKGILHITLKFQAWQISEIDNMQIAKIADVFTRPRNLFLECLFQRHAGCKFLIDHPSKAKENVIPTWSIHDFQKAKLPGGDYEQPPL